MGLGFPEIPIAGAYPGLANFTHKRVMFFDVLNKVVDGCILKTLADCVALDNGRYLTLQSDQTTSGYCADPEFLGLMRILRARANKHLRVYTSAAELERTESLIRG